MSAQKNLSKEQMRFCELYAGGMSAKAAYAEAFDNDDADQARCNGSRLLKKPLIHDTIIRLQEDIYKSMCLNAEKIAIRLAEIGFADKNDEIYTPQIQLKALDMLQKQFGLQKQNIKADVEQTVINVTIDEGEKTDGEVETDT